MRIMGIKKIINYARSLPESTRKKILVLSVSATMVFVSFVWFSSMKINLFNSDNDDGSSQSVKEIGEGLKENLEKVNIQGSSYDAVFGDILKNIEENNKNQNETDEADKEGLELDETDESADQNSADEENDGSLIVEGEDVVEENNNKLPEAVDVEN